MNINSLVNFPFVSSRPLTELDPNAPKVQLIQFRKGAQVISGGAYKCRVKRRLQIG